MPLTVNVKNARLNGMALAKVGSPARDEPLQTSRDLCQFSEEDTQLLTGLLLKPFRSLEPYHLDHHADVTNNDLHRHVTAIFEDGAALLEEGANIARLLYEKSTHPQIKAGDLCTALLDDLIIEGGTVQGL
ncbi:MAG: hypothetical protein AAGJ31_08390, partial [Verrucomicrobiota bacterium]